MGVEAPPFDPNEVTTHPASATSTAVSGHAAGLHEDSWGATLCNCAALTQGQETVNNVLPPSADNIPIENGVVPTAAKEFAPDSLLTPGLLQIMKARATRNTTPNI